MSNSGIYKGKSIHLKFFSISFNSDHIVIVCAILCKEFFIAAQLSLNDNEMKGFIKNLTIPILKWIETDIGANLK